MIGNFDARLDAKRRIAIASGIREQMSADQSDSFVLVPALDPSDAPATYLWMYPEKYFNKFLGRMRRSTTPQSISSIGIM